MFTGLVSEVGRITSAADVKAVRRFEVVAPRMARKLKKGDSVSINGVCQTVVSKNGSRFSFLAVPETLKKTNFESLQAGSRVNLELPLKLSDRLGGHFVAGHVDAKERLVKIEKKNGKVEWWIDLPKEFYPWVVKKGSVAVEGVSLTVADLKPHRFKVALIPSTLKATTLGEKKAGDWLNIEFDLLGKYAAHWSEETERLFGKARPIIR